MKIHNNLQYLVCHMEYYFRKFLEKAKTTARSKIKGKREARKIEDNPQRI